MRRWNRRLNSRNGGSEQSKRRVPRAAPAFSRLPRVLEMLEQRFLLTAIPTTIELAASQSPVPHGMPVNLIATVAASPAPSEGTVTFTEGTTLLGSAAVSSGSAQLSNVLLADGDHVITASYSDSLGNYGPSSTQVGGDSLISTVAGGGIDDNIQATSASLAYPWGIAFNAAGDLFIADTNMHRIRKVDHATGIITTFVGNGESIYSGDGGPATSAGLNYPEGIAINSVGDLFIADAGDHRIRKVDHVTGVITTVAGNGVAGYSGDGGLATAAELNSPASIAVDSAGHIFIADSSNSRIREVDAIGVIRTVAGNGSNGYSGDGGEATSAQLSGSAQIAGPRGIAVNSLGDLFIADTSNHRIRRVDHATGIITTVAGDGTRGFSGDGGQAASAELQFPEAITIDSAGDMFIDDSSNKRIRKVDATGVITTIAGNGFYGASGDGGQATAANLASPSALALNSAGDLFIADTDNRRIRKVDHATGVITTFAGNGGLFGYFGDGGPATAAGLGGPEGIALDSAGDQFILDYTNSRVRKVDHTTGVITTVAGSARGYFGDEGLATSAGLNLPSGVVVDTAGDLFIADTNNQRIRKIDHATGIITTVAGNGQSGYSGDGGPAKSASLRNPQGIAVDSSGNLFIADTYNERIRKVDHATGFITTVAGNGQYGYYGEHIAASASGLSDPVGVAVDSAGNLFVVDSSNPRIQRVDRATGAITTVAGNGHSAYSGDGGLATAAALFGPRGVAVDSAGNLFIGGALRVRKVDHATGVISTVVGDGLYGYSGDGVAANSTALAGPWGLALDPSGDLFITDDSRVREIAAHNLLLSVVPSVTVQDGYISGATVFYDADSDGLQGADEPSAKTGPDGVAPLGVPSGGPGQLVVTGGVDVSTGLRLPVTLTAPEGYAFISPLTTLVNQLVQSSSASTVADAEQSVKNAFALPSGVDLATYDPIAQGLAGDSQAASVFAAAAQVQDTIVQAANLVSGASGKTTSDAADLVVAAIANSISTSSSPLDLADQPAIQAILDAALSASGGSPDSTTITDVAKVIAQGNAAVSGLGASDYTAFLQSASQVQVVAQGPSSQQIKQVGLGTASAAELASPVVWDGGGGDLDWNNALNWSTDTLPGPGDDVIIGLTNGAVTDSSDTTIHSFHITGDLDISGGMFTTAAASSIGGTLTLGGGSLALGGDTTAANFTLAGGTLDGDGDLTIIGSLEWSDGGVGPDATLALASGATGTIAGNGFPVLWGTLRNAGILDVQQNLFVVRTNNSVGALENAAGGATNLVDDAGITYFGGGSYGASGPGLVNNAGTFGHTGTGSSAISAVFDNTGTINAQDEALHFTGGGSLTGSGINGGINLEGGDFTIDTTGPGRLIVAGNINVADGGKASNLLLEAGRLSSAGMVTVTGSFNWSSGELPPATTLLLPESSTGTIAGNAGNGFPVLWGTLRNAGTLDVEQDLRVVRTDSSVGALENLAGGAINLADKAGITSFEGGSYGAIGSGLVHNAGTFGHTGTGSSTISAVFNNTGTIDVQAGTLSLTDNSLPFDATGGLSSQPGATFWVAGDLTGAPRNTALFTPLGTTVFNGSSNESNPQLVEAMSRDLGNGAASFNSNLAYGAFVLGGSTYLKLVDNAADDGPEAVYVDSLTVPDGATLDLNHLHLYVRQMQLDGRVLNGTVLVAPEATIDSFRVQKGAAQRSFIRYIDASISDAGVAAALAGSLGDDDPTNDRVRLLRFEPDGSGSGQSVSLAHKAKAADQVFSLDFGRGGLTGNPLSTLGNGYYELDFDLDGDGVFETARHFYRLAGDVNGDRTVDDLDQAAVNAAFGYPETNQYEDINGDTVVNVLDRALVAKGKGLSLAGNLDLDA